MARDALTSPESRAAAVRTSTPPFSDPPTTSGRGGQPMRVEVNQMGEPQKTPR